ncbi:MAG TPA: FecR domain-containing protein [Steroidobacteraceae bacterium]|nr:FecR domain-containing protein [Steroidobacteraceae bacterium]
MKIYRLLGRRAIAEEAVAWLVRLDGDEPPTREELDAFREWLGRSAIHREEINSLNKFWSNNVLTELAVPLGEHSRRRPRVWNRRALVLYACAATLLLTVAVAFVPWLASNVNGINGSYTTAVGQQETVALVDGSTLTLNTNSQVKVEYSDQYRDVQVLQGEVYFQVAKNSHRPFRVYAGNGRVQAVGTAFTVYLRDESMDVTVTEGRISLASLAHGASALLDSDSRSVVHEGEASAAVARADVKDAWNSQQADEGIDSHRQSQVKDLALVDAGQRATLGIASKPRDSNAEAVEIQQVDIADIERQLSWRAGQLVFSGEPLAQVIDEVSRYTTVEIELGDSSIGDIQIGGRFRVGDIESMFIALQTNFGLKVTHVGNNHVLVTAAR